MAIPAPADTRGLPDFLPTYAIVGSPRSGSNFLCNIIRNCGVLGNPGEHFEDFESFKVKLPNPGVADQVWSHTLIKGTSANGIRAVKLFPSLLWVWPSPAFNALLPRFKFVQLRRRDLVDQAVSWSLGYQTNRWSSLAKGGNKAPRYDAKLIRQNLVATAVDSALWDRWIEQWGCESITLYYEDVRSDSLAAVNRIAGLMGIEALQSVSAEVELNVQRDATNQEFKERFLREESRAFDLIEGMRN